MKNIFIVIVLILTSAIVNTATAESIQFVPGLDGATKMITPWGDYLAIQNGNEIWVGTEKEYMDNKADAISAEHGFKPVMLNGQRTYISANALSSSVGKTEIYQISTTIVFGVKASVKEKRPPKPSDSEYVSVVWNQSGKAKIGLRIIATVNQRSFIPNTCGNDGVFYYCEFTIPKSNLITPAMYVFYAVREKPSAIPIKSVAKREFEDIQEQYRTVLRGIEPGNETKQDLQELHKIDSSIPTTP